MDSKENWSDIFVVVYYNSSCSVEPVSALSAHGTLADAKAARLKEMDEYRTLVDSGAVDIQIHSCRLHSPLKQGG